MKKPKKSPFNIKNQYLPSGDAIRLKLQDETADMTGAERIEYINIKGGGL